MNIKEAKQQIKNAIIAYSTQDKYGKYIIPVQKQRPIFLIGAPGIGKTAIMEQIASELDINLVSYSMTHHTRQSALGLPFILDKQYGNENYKVSEYTMSEIIASVYDSMEETGKDRGILFLDEINCISETLAPSMLQFLQYKTFGRHRVPDGWIVVTAGNPAEFNNSVKEFDIAMWDRLKKIEVEANYDIWKEFAVNTHVHPVVTSYLSIKSNNFYSISTTIDGKSFVTARGWDDLSQMIMLYEMNDIAVDYNLISQYIQDEKIAKDFSHYYQLFHKYQADYKVDTIVDGCATDDIKERAANAKFDERLSLIALIMSTLDETISTIVLKEDAIRQVMKTLKGHKPEEYQGLYDAYKKEGKHQPEYYLVLDILSDLMDTPSPKQYLQDQLVALKEMDQIAQSYLENTFNFFEEVFGQGQEILILVTELTINQTTSKYIYTHGCDSYYKHNKQLLFKDKQSELLEKIDAINLLELDD